MGLSAHSIIEPRFELQVHLARGASACVKQPNRPTNETLGANSRLFEYHRDTSASFGSFPDS